MSCLFIRFLLHHKPSIYFSLQILQFQSTTGLRMLFSDFYLNIHLCPPPIILPNLNRAPSLSYLPLNAEILAPFQPDFLLDDQILNILFNYKICSLNGTVFPPYDQSCFPHFKNYGQATEEDKKVCAHLTEHFDHTHNCQSQKMLPIGRLKSVPSLDTAFSLHLIFHTSLKTYSESIKQIDAAGSSIFSKLKEYPFFKACCAIFPIIDTATIQQWISCPHIQARLKEEGCDEDYRIWIKKTNKESQQGEEFLGELSSQTLKLIAAQTKPFNTNDYALYLEKSLNAKHRGNLKDKSHVRLLSLTEFGGVSTIHRIFEVSVDHVQSNYDILNIQTTNKPIDVLFIHTLKKRTLFSSTSLAISLKKFITNQTKRSLELNCKPFSPAKYLVDFLCSIATIAPEKTKLKTEKGDESKLASYPIDTRHWLEFLRGKSLRFTQQNLEKALVEHVMNEKPLFVRQQQNLRQKEQSEVKGESEVKDERDSTYIYQLLEKYIEKHVQKHRNATVEIFIITFKACQSLSLYSSMNDKELRRLWKLMDEKYLNKLETNNLLGYASLKAALLTQKIPFTTVSAWMQLLLFIFYPTSLSKHQELPTFRPTYPFLPVLLPAQPLNALQTLLPLLNSKQSDVEALKEIYLSFITPKNSLAIYPSPLTPYIPYLNSPPQQLNQIAHQWIQHPHPFISYIGFQLYFATPGLIPNQAEITHLLKSLIKIFHRTIPKPHVISVLNALEKISGMAHDKGSVDAIRILKRTYHSLNRIKLSNWLYILAQTRSPKHIQIAYQLLIKELPQRWQKLNKKAVLSVFINLRSYQAPTALRLYKMLQAKRHFIAGKGLQEWLSPEENIRCLTLLCQAYTNAKTSLALSDLDWIELGNVIQLWLEKDSIAIHDTSLKEQFSQALACLISKLYHLPDGINLGDDVLIQASRQKYLINPQRLEVWTKRLAHLLQKEQPSATIFTILLFRIAIEEQFLEESVVFDDTGLQNINLLLKSPSSRTDFKHKNLLQIAEAIARAKTLNDSGGFVVDFIQTEIKEDRVDSTLISLLARVASIAPFIEVLSLFKNFIEFLLKNLRQIDQKLIEQIDLVFIQHYSLLLNQDCSPLLSYLDKTLKSSTATRLPQAWLLLEQILVSSHLDPLLYQLSILLTDFLLKTQTLSQPIPQIITEWLSIHSSQILECFQKQNNIEKAKQFLCALNSSNQASTILYTLWICQNTKEIVDRPQLDQLLSLLHRETIEDLNQCMTEKDLPFFESLMRELIRYNNKQDLNEAIYWLKICLNKTNNTNLLSLSFKCLNLLNDYSSLKAMQFVRDLRFLESDYPQARLYFQQFISKINNQCASQIAESIYLQPNIYALFEHDLPLIQKEVEIILLKIINLRHDAIAPLLDIANITNLLRLYQIDYVETWETVLKFFNGIELTSSSDLRITIWKLYNQAAKNFTPYTLIHSQCWYLALKLIALAQHLEPDFRLENASFLDEHFPDTPSTEFLRKSALYILLIDGIKRLINNSNPTLVQLILEKLKEIKDPALIEHVHLWLVIVMSQSSNPLSDQLQAYQILKPYLTIGKKVFNSLQLVQAIEILGIALLKVPKANVINLIDAQNQYLEAIKDVAPTILTPAASINLLNLIMNTKTPTAFKICISLVTTIVEKGNEENKIQFQNIALKFIALASHHCAKNSTLSAVEELSDLPPLVPSTYTEDQNEKEVSHLGHGIDPAAAPINNNKLMQPFIKHENLNELENCLRQILKWVNFSNEEIALICHEFLICQLDYKFKQVKFNAADLEQVIYLYQEWIPPIFYRSDLVQACQVSLITILSLAFQEPALINIESLIGCAGLILCAKYKIIVDNMNIALLECPAFATYTKKTFEIWIDQDLATSYLLAALYQVIVEICDSHIGKKFPKEILQKELISLLDLSVEYSIPLNLYQIEPYQGQSFYESARLTLLKVQSINCLQDPEKYLEYCFYYQMNVTSILSSKIQRSISIKTLNQILLYDKFPHSLPKAYDSLHRIQNLTSIHETDSLIVLYKHVLVLCLKHPTLTIEGKIVFDHVYHSTFNPLKEINMLVKAGVNQLRKLCEIKNFLLINYICSNHSTPCSFNHLSPKHQLSYILVALKVLKKLQEVNQESNKFKRNLQDYTKDLDKLIQASKQLILKEAFTNKNEVEHLSLTICTRAPIAYKIIEVIIGLSKLELNHKSQKLPKQILIRLIQSWLEPQKEKSASQLFDMQDHLLAIITTSIFTSFIHEDNAQDRELMDSIRQWMPTDLEPSRRLSLGCLYLQFYSSKFLKHYEIHLETVEGLLNLAKCGIFHEEEISILARALLNISTPTPEQQQCRASLFTRLLSIAFLFVQQMKDEYRIKESSKEEFQASLMKLLQQGWDQSLYNLETSVENQKQLEDIKNWFSIYGSERVKKILELLILGFDVYQHIERIKKLEQLEQLKKSGQLEQAEQLKELEQIKQQISHYYKIIIGMMPSLKSLILEHQDFDPSHYLISFISKLPSSQAKQKWILLKMWFNMLKEPLQATNFMLQTEIIDFHLLQLAAQAIQLNVIERNSSEHQELKKHFQSRLADKNSKSSASGERINTQSIENTPFFKECVIKYKNN